MSELDAVALFLTEQKRLAGRRMRWRPKNVKSDYRYFDVVAVVESGAFEAGVLHMTAHINRVPRKYGFNLKWRGADVLRLDVHPGRTHVNRSKEIIRGTHWQAHPDFDAEQDGRELPHQLWLDAFLRRANISGGRLAYAPPPFERIQYELGI